MFFSRFYIAYFILTSYVRINSLIEFYFILPFKSTFLLNFLGLYNNMLLYS